MCMWCEFQLSSELKLRGIGECDAANSARFSHVDPLFPILCAHLPALDNRFTRVGRPVVGKGVKRNLNGFPLASRLHCKIRLEALKLRVESVRCKAYLEAIIRDGRLGHDNNVGVAGSVGEMVEVLLRFKVAKPGGFQRRHILHSTLPHDGIILVIGGEVRS